MVNTNELMVLDNIPAPSPNGQAKATENKTFIEANTIEMSFKEMRDRHIIPVFGSTNEPLISHTEFISTLWDIANQNYKGEVILEPQIRVSHPVKGRIPDAKHKPASLLEPWEETIYYERAMFVIEIPTIMEDVNGNMLSLNIGGVKAYNLDNIHCKRPSHEQTFKIFIGFKNRVCCNLCVWSDGYVEETSIKSLSQLQMAAKRMIQSYNMERHLKLMKGMNEFELSEPEFAQIIGRGRMYRHLPEKAKQEIQPLLLGDQQLGTVVRDYYNDQNFCHDNHGKISLWKMYNLLTGANKSTYIDQFLERTVNAHDFIDGVAQHKAGHSISWFLS